MNANTNKNDMTVGTEWKQVLLFSLPIMAGNLLQQLYNTVDGIVVGNFVSQNALAATGTAGTLALVFLAFSIGFGNGSGIMVSQLFGARRESELRGAVSTSLLLMTGIGLAFSLFGCFCSRFLLSKLMNVAAGEVLEDAVVYFSIYSLGFVLQFLYNAVAAILRAVGDSKATLYFLLVSSVINLVLDLLFVIVFHWDVAGAAIATVLSQLGSAVVSIIYMFKKYPLFRFKRGEFVFVKDKCLLCLRLGIPTTIQQSIVSFGNVFIQRLVNSFGEAAMAAFTVGSRVENYIFVTAVGFNIGSANFTGQNVGAQKYDRVKRGCYSTIIVSTVVSLLLELLSYIFAPQISALFGVSGEALSLSIDYTRFLSYLFWTFAIYMVLSGTLQGAGDVMLTTICSLVALSIRVSFAYAMVYFFQWDCSAVWKAMPIGWSCALFVALGRFISGKWKQKGIIRDE